MKYKYYSVYEYFPGPDGEDKKRRIYTFDNEPAANDLVEFLLDRDFLYPVVGIEEEYGKDTA